MRHEATSRLFEDKNLHMAEVMAVTGHKDPRSMLRYTHLQTYQLAEKLGQLLISNEEVQKKRLNVLGTFFGFHIWERILTSTIEDAAEAA